MPCTPNEILVLKLRYIVFKLTPPPVTAVQRCFDPIIDGASGEDLLPMMVHSRQTKDHDFSGMYCLALRAAGKVASCAVIRIFGNKLAEMPLVATSLDARRQVRGLVEKWVRKIGRRGGKTNSSYSLGSVAAIVLEI